MKLSDYLSEIDKPAAEYPYTSLPEEFALLRAMAAGVKELEMTPEQFLTCMRYAISANLYKQYAIYDRNTDKTISYPTILAMKITVI